MKKNVLILSVVVGTLFSCPVVVGWGGIKVPTPPMPRIPTPPMPRIPTPPILKMKIPTPKQVVKQLEHETKKAAAQTEHEAKKAAAQAEHEANNPIYTDPTGHWDLRKTVDKAREIGTKAIKGVQEGTKRELIAIHNSEGFILGYAQNGVENVRGHSVNFIRNPSKEFRGNQNLRLGAQIAATYYGGPGGAAAYAAFATKAYGGSDEDAIRAAAIAGAAAYAHDAIGAGGGIAGAPIRIGVHGVIGGLAAEANGGNFDDGFQESADSALYKEIYYGLSKDDPTWEKGGKATRKGEGEAVVNPRNNNIGKSRSLSAKGAPGFIEEGGTVSLVANEVPGMNSGAVIHDYVAEALEVNNAVLDFITNQGTIIPVIAINYYYGLDMERHYSEDQLRRSKYESAR